MTIDIDLTEEELQKLEKIQQQYGLDSIEAAADMLAKRYLIGVQQQLTGNIGLPSWVNK